MASPLDGKTFILGIGAQKAGTTWLAEYLDGRPEVFMAPLMEMHYFDAQYVPGHRESIDALFKKERKHSCPAANLAERETEKAS